MTQKIFLSIIFGFLTGVLIASIFSIGLSFVFVCALLGLSFLVLGIFNLFPRALVLTLSIFFIFVSIGLLRFYIKDSNEPKHTLDNFVGQSIFFEGVVLSEVDAREASQRLLVKAENLNFRGEDYEINQKILVSTERFPEYAYGDRVEVSGNLETPENFITDIGKEFDYKSYLKKDSIFYSMSFAHVEALGSGEGSGLKSAILSVKHKFLESINSVIPQPESALLGGLLLGTKQSLGEKLQQSFVDTGLVHIVVLSGYNVTIIAESLIKALSIISVSAWIIWICFTYFGGTIWIYCLRTFEIRNFYRRIIFTSAICYDQDCLYSICRCFVFLRSGRMETLPVS